MFDFIFSKLQRQGVKVAPASLKKHAHQGLMSAVYSARSNRGELIIHVINPAQEWVRQRIWEKLPALADMLKKYPAIPTADFLAAGRLEKTHGQDQYFLVQKKLAGRVAGKRELINNQVKDIWRGSSKTAKAASLQELQKIIAAAHKIKVSGYGYPWLKDGKLVGPFKSWSGFFKAQLPLWLRSVKAGDRRLKVKPARQKKLNELLNRVKQEAQLVIKTIPDVPPVLIHGDAINPSNILLKDKHISGLLDWEWAIYGDPAWEFCDPGWWPLLNERDLAPYRQARGYSREEFQNLIKRAKSYRLLWILWGAHLHAGDRDLAVYRVLQEMMAEEIRQL